MNIFSVFRRLKKELVVSSFLHLAVLVWISSLPFFRKPIVYSPPLFVDVVRVEKPRPVKKKPPPQQEKKARDKPKPKPQPKPAKKPETKKEEKPEKAEKTTPEKPAEGQETPVVPQSQIAVEAVEFPFAYYLNIIQTRVTENWSPQAVREGAKTVVYFRVLPGGEISGIRVHSSSGQITFDRAALRAVTLTRLPPLPQEFTGRHLGIHFGFILEGEQEATDPG